MKIELLYFEECPGWQKTLQNLEEVLKELNLKVKVELCNANSKDFNPACFYGSPSIRVNGKDLEGRTGEHFMGCRLYQDDKGKNFPYMPKEQVRKYLQEVLKNEQNC